MSVIGAYVAMSTLVVWHTVAMVVAAAPESALTRSARALMQPYLTLLRLDNNWGFFAPNVPRGTQLRYTVEAATGTKHTFIPQDRVNRLDPNALFLLDRFKEIILSDELFGETAGQTYCRSHADLRPVSVTLIAVHQKEFSPEDRLDGKHPLDPEFIEVDTLRTVPCPSR
jgi:hypothetical protein